VSKPGKPADPPTARQVLAAQEVRLVSALVLLLGVGLFFALPFVLSIGAVVFLPFVAGIFFSIMLAPLADRLTRWKVPTALAALLALIAFIVVVLALLALILAPALDVFDQVPKMFAQISAQLAELRSNFNWLNDFNRQLARITGQAGTREVVVASPSLIQQLALATPTVVVEVLLTLLVTYFMIAARTRVRHSLLLDRASLGSSRKAGAIMRAVQDRVTSYILTVSLINLGVGVVVATGAWLYGLEAPVMWGGLAAMLNFLPYVGPLVMASLLALFGLGTQDNLILGLIPPLAFLGLHAVESNVVTPSILGRRFTMNPVLILFSISYFSWIWGVAGALLSIPILITLKALFEHIGAPNLVGFIFGEPLFDLPELDES
jgi:predicted PurR-regulated permease PerM